MGKVWKLTSPRDRITNFVTQLPFTSLVAEGLNDVGAHHPRPKSIKKRVTLM